jgi:hypothetical protein
MYWTACFLSPQVSYLFGKRWHHVKQVAYNPIGCYFKDRCLSVAVDGNNHVCFLHANQVLDSAAYATGDVYDWPHSLAGLTDLSLRRHPSSLYCTPGRAHHSTQLIGQFL